MIKITLKFIPLLLFSLGIAKVEAQNAVLTSGGDAVGGGGTASYSIGQLDYLAISSANGSMSQGVQQPFVSSVLPITILGLKAIKKEDKVLVEWETATEINSSKFVVQRSKDGVTFSGINEVTASGNSNTLKQYFIEDVYPLSGPNFYRIKQIDKDGSAVYSKVVSIDFNVREGIAVVYPNPTKQNIILKVSNSADRVLSYQLYNVKGNLIRSNKITTNETRIRITNLSSGNYFLKVIENNKQIKTFQIIKTN